MEVHQDGLVLWTSKLRRHVDELVMQMSVRGVLDLVYRAEEHATEFQRLADALERWEIQEQWNHKIYIIVGFNINTIEA